MTISDDKKRQIRSDIGHFSFHTASRGISSFQYASYTPGENTDEYAAFIGEATAEAMQWQAFMLFDPLVQLRQCIELLRERCWTEDGNLSYKKLLQLRRSLSEYEFGHLRRATSGTRSVDTFEYLRYGKDLEEEKLIQQSALSAAWSHYCEGKFSPVWLAGSAVFALLAHKNEFAFGYLASQLDQKLRNEDDAMRGKKTLAGAASGGATRSRENSAEKRKRLEKMRSFIAKGHSVRRAAQLTHSSGLGVSAEANKKLWTRNTRK